MPIERLGPYEIRRKIGRGGMGAVYEGVHSETGEVVAVKLLSASLAHEPDFRHRFQSEIETLRMLNHPNIVRLFGFGEQDEHLFYAMELVVGSSLEEELGRGRTFTWREVTQIGIDVAIALRHAHDRGVIHRDIKPGNLLMTADGHVKLSDFGIARFFGGAKQTTAGSVLGTAEFMSPEQADGRPVSPRSDLYSLGGVLYVLLARRPLFRGSSLPEILLKQRMEQPAPLSEVAPDVPLELQQIVSQLLEKDSEKRIPTATVLLRRLEAMEHAISLASPVAPVSPAPAPIELAETKATAAFVNSPEPTISEPGKTAGRFTLVGKDELDPADSGQSSSSLVQTGVLIASLIAIAATIWYLLQPPTADALFDRIEARTANGDPESLLHAEDDIRSFLSRFHKDSRCERMKEYEHQIELYRLQQKFERRAKGHGGVESLLPVERAYVDALNYSRLDPDRGMLKFQALIDLYKERPGLAGPAGECLELAQRQLARLREQIEATAAEHLGQLQDRLDRADQIRKSDPARAEAMYRAAIVLYGDKQWAAQAVRRAKEALNDKEKPNH